MFNLYETVKGSPRISDRSFSIKKLGPLYMAAGRVGVTNAVDSMVQYSVYQKAVTPASWRTSSSSSPRSRTPTNRTASARGSCGTGC